jgi:hypothetical protein
LEDAGEEVLVWVCEEWMGGFDGVPGNRQSVRKRGCGGEEGDDCVQGCGRLCGLLLVVILTRV